MAAHRDDDNGNEPWGEYRRLVMDTLQRNEVRFNNVEKKLEGLESRMESIELLLHSLDKRQAVTDTKLAVFVSLAGLGASIVGAVVSQVFL